MFTEEESEVRCICGCGHVVGKVVDETLKIEFTHCKCDDLHGSDADFFNANYHCVIPKDKYKFIPYYEYIKSSAWKMRSLRAKIRARFRCQVCNKHYNEIQLDTHHRTYERLGSERNDDLIVLCRKCHALYEHNKNLL